MNKKVFKDFCLKCKITIIGTKYIKLLFSFVLYQNFTLYFYFYFVLSGLCTDYTEWIQFFSSFVVFFITFFPCVGRKESDTHDKRVVEFGKCHVVQYWPKNAVFNSRANTIHLCLLWDIFISV